MAEASMGVVERERLEAFDKLVRRRLNSNHTGEYMGPFRFELFKYVLRNDSTLPDAIRKKAWRAILTKFYQELQDCERAFLPDEKEYTVDVNVAPTSFSMKVKATSKEEAEELVQRTIDGRSLDADAVLSVTNAVLSSVEALEVNDDRV